MSNHNDSNPDFYEPRHTWEETYHDTDVLALDTVERENMEYDDSPGDAIAERMTRVDQWVGDCREMA